MAGNVVFSISTQLEMEGRQLKAIKPDKDGIYKGIPLTVIGCDSRNNVNYEKDSVIKCITDAQSRFAANVGTGDMEGEWGHPLLEGENCLSRLLYIDRTKISHYFTKVYGKDTGNGLIMIYGDVKPFGPYGKYLKESFEDPCRNTSFSLRSAAVKTGVQNGIVQKKMLSLVTFDAVDGPGFLKASKRFSDPDVATESYQCHIPDPDKRYNVDIEVTKAAYLKSQESLKVAGLESIITDQAVLDAFGCDKITIRDKVITRIGRDKFRDENGGVSLFGMCFGS